jgi:ABC-2 type transport system ATP-binding protein
MLGPFGLRESGHAPANSGARSPRLTAVLVAHDLGKIYGRGPGAVKALDGLSLEIPRGGVYGVLGPNGAGKSTFFRVALGLVRATQGGVRLLGATAGRDAHVRRRVGSMIETPRFHPYLTGRETLQFLARASGVRVDDLDARLDRVGLADAAGRKVSGYSVGMKQRLGVAAALLGAPEAVILDEPTSGMDPAGIQEMRALMRTLADRDGVTVLLASHQLAEVQKVCDRVAILDHGRLAAEGRVDALVGGQDRLRLTVSPVEAALEVAGPRATREGDAVLVALDRSEAPELIRALVARGVDLTEARWVGGDLETVFLRETGEARAG